MDRDTVINSVRYRCWQRGETLGEFVEEYCSEDELVLASAQEGIEGEFATALLDMRRALMRAHKIAERIPERDAG